MRAGRLIAMLITLRQRGRMTATQLADQLEVSPRTVLRDVQALNEAGLPIFTTQGAGGGIELLGGLRDRLSDLTDEDAQALLLAGQPALASALGLGTVASVTRQSLLEALPDRHREAALDLDRWFLHDPTGRGAPAVDAAVLRRVARAARESLVLRVGVTSAGAGPADRPACGSAAVRGEGGRTTVQPLGLVLDAGRWVLVHLDDSADDDSADDDSADDDSADDDAADDDAAGDDSADAAVRITPLERLSTVELTSRRFTRPGGFDLALFWAQATRQARP